MRQSVEQPSTIIEVRLA